MKIGFTGTRHGLAPPQEDALRSLLKRIEPAIVAYHHGAAIGADEEFARDVFGIRQFRYAPIIAHPCTLTDQVSQWALKYSDEVRDPLPPLERNRNIVAACDLLIGCPAGQQEEQRSGTWATIRAARKAGKQIVILWPDGTQSEEPAS
jgi:hypothetical protein